MYGNFGSVSKNFQGVLEKFHGCHSEISRVFQKCCTGDSSLLSQFHGEFQEGFKGLSSKLQGSSKKFQGSFIEVSKIFNRSFQG